MISVVKTRQESMVLDFLAFELNIWCVRVTLFVYTENLNVEATETGIY